MLMRFDPFRDLDRLTQQAYDNLQSRAPVMPMDAYRRGDEFYVEFDLPGVDPSTVELTVEKNVLSVSAERERTIQQGDDLLVNERMTGRFSRQLFLGETLDANSVRADYERGVLRLTIPVAEQAKPRRVEINVGETSRTITAGE